MSIQAVGWVLDHSPTRGADRLVLISIANHAGQSPSDGAWEAWPGIDLIQREAGLERRRTVQDALARLIEAGAIERIVNGAPDERMPADRRPNLYRIRLDHGVTRDVTPTIASGVTPDAHRGDARRRDGVTRGDATGCRPASPKPLSEPSEEPSEEPLLRVESTDAGFDEFWAVYPRKVSKGDARRVWPAAVKRAGSGSVIVQGATRYAAERSGQDPSFTAHPSTWLRGDRWADEPTRSSPKQSGRYEPSPEERRDGPSGRLRYDPATGDFVPARSRTA